MNKINQVLVDILKVTKDKVTEDLGMGEVDSWDSLTHMGLIVAIEETFDIELSGDDIADMISFDAIRTIVSKYLD